MATSGDSLEQSIAAELIILSVSKKERATAIIKTGLPALKMLYNSSDQNVKVRALAGQRAYKVVKPMVYILHSEVERLASSEVLLTLTNSRNSLRKRILEEKSIPKINYEGLIFYIAHKVTSQCAQSVASSTGFATFTEDSEESHICNVMLMLLCKRQQEFVIDDRILLKALVSLPQSAGAMFVFTLAVIYVNLSNVYEKPTINEEMVK
ncbi:myosin-binding striated muscle assembly central domain-containing protein [Ditylenchus destructor]|nr:myosin-binding striated muscle assembly central domain-containing protein [Ditylenchus destructor]